MGFTAPEIEKMMTLSTIQLCPKTRHKLAKEQRTNALGLTMYDKGSFGWYLYINDVAMSAMNQLLIKHAFPDLYTCINFARAHDCTVLCFDCDAEPTGGLTFYPDDSGNAKTACIYAVCYSGKDDDGAAISWHKTFVTADEGEALCLIGDSDKVSLLTRSWYYGNQWIKQRHDNRNKTWDNISIDLT